MLLAEEDVLCRPGVNNRIRATKLRKKPQDCPEPVFRRLLLYYPKFDSRRYLSVQLNFHSKDPQ